MSRCFLKSDIRPEVTEDDVTMVLTVVEKPSRNLEYGLTRSKSGDVQGSFDFGHGNVGGGFESVRGR